MYFELGELEQRGETIPYEVERTNLLIVGKLGIGKSETTIRLALNDIRADRKVVFIGSSESADEILKFVPNRRQEETIYFNPTRQPMSANPFWYVPEFKHNSVADTFTDAFLSRSNFAQGETPRIENLVTGSVLTILKQQTESPLALYYLLTKKEYRQTLTKQLGNKLSHFWGMFESLQPRDQRIETSSTINKLSKLVYDPALERSFDQQGNYLNIENGITVVSLDRFKLGDGSYFLAGAMVIANLVAQVAEDTDITVYVDDAEMFGSRVLSRLLQSPGVTSVLTTGSVHNFQDPNEIMKSCNIVALEMSAKDARLLSDEFRFDEGSYELTNLPEETGYVMMWGTYADSFKLIDHQYTEPRKRKKKTVSERIISRCGDQCSQSPMVISKRLMRFFEG